MEFTGSIEIGGRDLTFSTGKIARQAQGAVEIQYGDTVVLTTAGVSDPKNLPFFPLTVEYREMTYAAGKIPGGFFKREGRPSSHEIVSARLTDRAIRPIFPDGYKNEVQVVSTVLSAEEKNMPNVLSIVGASIALMIADTPFNEPLGAVRLGYNDGQLIVNPSKEMLENSLLDLVVAGTEEAITMVEASATEVSEEIILNALDRAHEEIKKIIQLEKQLVAQCQKPQSGFEAPEYDEQLIEQIKTAAREQMESAVFLPTKHERNEAKSAVQKNLEEKYLGQLDELEDEVEKDKLQRSFSRAVSELEAEVVRQAVINEQRRIDGRALDEVRHISAEVGRLPRPHGSSLFTRGETQSLASVTLGTPRETQRIDSLFDETEKRFMLHYNFPPFSVGEVRRITGPKRREIGHGLMAESAIEPLFPEKEDWPYSTRVVSEILESNGSSSMATVCSASLALMDAGVPLPKHVSGIAMGLIIEGDQHAILTDILGDEDHLGDMDFKIAGTKDGITSLQMDIKVKGVDRQIMEAALEQGNKARMEILEIMNSCLDQPRSTISEYAPRLYTLEISNDKIRDLIGPGGKNIRKIIDETGATIDVEDDGTVYIGATDGESGDRALEMVENCTKEAKPGEIYEGTVVSTTDFGAFVEILPGQDGLVHISELADYHVKKTTDIVEVGDVIKVKCMGISEKGIELSKVEADKQLNQEN